MGTAVLGIVLVVVGILFGGVGIGRAQEADPEPPVGTATLLILSPSQAWVHLYCKEERPALLSAGGVPWAPYKDWTRIRHPWSIFRVGRTCRVTFECNGQAGEPVTWTVDMEPKTIFSYWPNKTADDGSSADLQAALMDAGKTEEEALRRTTCEVSSVGNLAVRGYTRFGGDPTLIPVAVYD